LPNGNQVVVNQIQGIAFDDLQTESPDQSTIDFTRSVVVSVEVIKPPPGVTPPAPGTPPVPGEILQQAEAGPPVPQPQDGSLTSEGDGASPVEQALEGGARPEGPVTEPGRSPESQGPDIPLPRPDTPEEEAELDRFFEGPGGRSADAEVQPEPGGAGDATVDQPVEGGDGGVEDSVDGEEVLRRRQEARREQQELDDKIDELLDDMESRMSPEDADVEPPVRGDDSDDGIIDGDETKSATDDF
jgi:hypothetical protein